MNRLEINGIEVAKVIGQPIDSAFPTPVEILEIADVETAEFGEDVYVFDYDENTDTVYTAADSGEVTSNKKSPSGATSLTFVGLQSDLAYVTLHELQDSKDNTALGRKKVAIGRSMDKEEVKRICDAILSLNGETGEPDLSVSLGTGDDLYDAIVKMVHQITNYGDNFVLLAGSTVWEKINTYDKENAAGFQYNVEIKKMLADNKITVVKMFGEIKLDSGSSTVVLAATKAILVARNSKIKGVGGKPILFVRRLINPEVAALLGIEPDAAQRLITTIGGLQVINNHKNILGYGVVGYEAIIEAITQYKAICFCDMTAIL
jgi:hypothetical protein